MSKLDKHTYGNISFKDFVKMDNDSIFQCYPLVEQYRYIPAILVTKYMTKGMLFASRLVHTDGNIGLMNVGADKFDTRCSYIIAIRSGHGKKWFNTNLRHSADIFGAEVADIATLSDSSQLIGTTIKEKHDIIDEETGKKKTIEIKVPNPGHLADNLMIAEDAVNLLISTQPRYVEARANLTRAADTWGPNGISKKLTADTKMEKLEYKPLMECIMFIQDKPIEFCRDIDEGFSRKMPIVFIDAPMFDEESRVSRMFMKADYSKHNEINVRINTNYKKCHSFQWLFSDDIKTYGAKKATELINSIRSKGAENYLSIMDTTIQNNLFRYAGMLAGTYELYKEQKDDYNVEVQEQHIDTALEEYGKILQAIIEYRTRFIDTEQELNDKEEVVVSVLEEHKATEDNPYFDTKKFVKACILKGSKLARIGKKSENTWRNTITKLKRSGVVQTKQLGQSKKGESNSAIWLMEVEK